MSSSPSPSPLLNTVRRGLDAAPLAALHVAVVTPPQVVPVVCWYGRVVDAEAAGAGARQVRVEVDVTVTRPSPYGQVHDVNFDFAQQTHRVALTFGADFPGGGGGGGDGDGVAAAPSVRFVSPILHYYLHPDTHKPGPLFRTGYPHCFPPDTFADGGGRRDGAGVAEAEAVVSRAASIIEGTLRSIGEFLTAPLDPFPTVAHKTAAGDTADAADAADAGADAAVATTPAAAQMAADSSAGSPVVTALEQQAAQRQRHAHAFYSVGDDHFEFIARVAALARTRRHPELFDCHLGATAATTTPAPTTAGSGASPGGEGGGGSASPPSSSLPVVASPSPASPASPHGCGKTFDPDGTWLAPAIRRALGLPVPPASATAAGAGPSAGLSKGGVHSSRSGDGGGSRGRCESGDAGTATAVSPTAAASDAALRALLREEGDGVYSFPLFTERFCELLLDELDAIAASGVPVARPNSMNNYGVVLNLVGMQPLFTLLQRLVFGPVARLLFPRVVGRGPRSGYFDSHHTFVVQYEPGKDLGLDMHTDASDVTFNTCLGREFTGAPLVFCGMQGDPTHRKRSLQFAHTRGRCVVHLGQRRHGAQNIASGQRVNLIMWCRSSVYEQTEEWRRRSMQQTQRQEDGPPDPVCLSYTHDRDYGVFKDYPNGTEKFAARAWCPPPAAQYDGWDAGKVAALAARGSAAAAAGASAAPNHKQARRESGDPTSPPPPPPRN